MSRCGDTLRRFALFVVALIALETRSPARGAEPGAPPPVDFAKDIRPLLSDRCFHCHGPDEKDRQGGFRLDEEKSALGAAESGAHPIVPGKPEASELVKRITSNDASEHMPPRKSNKTLTPHEIELLRRWIAEGAKWQQHWAFTAPAAHELPPVKNAAWAQRDLDRYTLAQLEREALKPAPVANRETLIRRLSFDLTGLPPTPSEIDAFLADPAADAYEKVVDRLLASPHYGEHMAAQWLDGARFADTNGFQNDFARMMWPWRDWVIKAYNDNLPYNQFVTEQIAGDLLPSATAAQKIATGFLRNNRSVTEGGSIEEEWHLENMVDRVETTSGVFLGLTMGCARCHDHKYDPIRQREFYNFVGFFNSSKDRGFYAEARGNTGPTEQFIQPEQQKRLAEFEAAIAKAEGELKTASADQTAKYEAWLKTLRDGPSAPAPVEANVRLALDGNLEISTSHAAPDKTEPLPAKYGEGKVKWGDGLLGKVLQLEGKERSYVDLGDVVQPARETPFSVACWVYPQGGGIGAFWSKMDDNAGFRGFDTLVFDDGKVEVHVVHHAPDNMLKVTASAQKLRLNQWNHVCVSYDGSSKAAGVKIYLDGKSVPLEVNADSLTDTIATAQPFRLGRRSGTLFLKGALSELSYFNRALTETEVQPLIDLAISRSAKLLQPANKASEKALQEYYESAYSASGSQKTQLARVRGEKDAFLKSAAIPTVMVLEEMEKPRPNFLFKRGQYDAPDKSAALEPGVPAFLPPLPEGAPRNRLGLAQWLTNPANPLVARVEANRLWQQFFGQGLVSTTDNFGFQGDPPTNRELLDYLAVKLVRLNWNVKALQKEIVLSATYQQSSDISPALAQRDPDNRLLARGPRFRLSAEAIRDNALAASGLLAPKVGGPSVKPYQPPGLWSDLAGANGEGAYKQDTGESLHRRSLYTYRKRTVPHPTTSTFDAPTWEICTARRSRTNTPLQALALLNDETYVEAGRALGERMLLEGGQKVDERLAYGFRLATGRRPAVRELALLAAALERNEKLYASDPAAAKAFLSVGEFRAQAKVEPSQLAAYAALGSLLLNLDETITNH